MMHKHPSDSMLSIKKQTQVVEDKQGSQNKLVTADVADIGPVTVGPTGVNPVTVNTANVDPTVVGAADEGSVTIDSVNISLVTVNVADVGQQLTPKFKPKFELLQPRKSKHKKWNTYPARNKDTTTNDLITQTKPASNDAVITEVSAVDKKISRLIVPFKATPKIEKPVLKPRPRIENILMIDGKPKVQEISTIYIDTGAKDPQTNLPIYRIKQVPTFQPIPRFKLLSKHRNKFKNKQTTNNENTK